MAISITSPFLSMSEKVLEICRQIRCAAFKDFHEVAFFRTRVTEENRKPSYRRVYSDTDIFSKCKFENADTLIEIAPRSIDCNCKQSKGGLGEEFSYGLKGGSKIEYSLANDKNYSKREANENSENSSTKNGIKPIPKELLSRDEIDEVLHIIRDFLFRGLPSSEEGGKLTTALKNPDPRSKTQNENCAESMEARQFDKSTESEIEGLLKEITSLKREAKQSLNNCRNEVSKLKEEVENLKATNQYLEKELKETLVEYGSLTVEHTKMVNDNKRMNREALYSRGPPSDTASSGASSSGISSSQSSLSSLSETPLSGSTFGAEAVKKPCETIHEEPKATEKSPVHETPVSVIVQVSMEESRDAEGISLGTVPTTAVERSLYNNYKLLFLTMESLLLSRDVEKLKEWAMETFAIDTSQDPIDIFLKLDRKGVITALNLTLLRGFFEKILRFDLIYLIDCFLSGSYSILRNANSSAFSRKGAGISSGRWSSRSPQGATATSKLQRRRIPTSDGVNPGFSSGNSEMVEIEEALVVDEPNLGASARNHRGSSPQELVVANGSGPAYKNDLKSARNSAVNEKEKGRITESRVPVERPAISHGSKPSFNMGSNGQKLSKFPRQNSQGNSGGNPQNSDDDSDDDVNEQWLCNHYKRRCHVKFACCNKYWPCHRCHNNESNCGQRKLKSIHTKFVKCTKCSTEQEFSERSQFCINCHTKFAKYFCPTCKHLTGKDDKPYHCAKCGICRIHKHRSFHCDVCGVCLDVQLQDNHRCRAGSAHDECCICLEDAFTGCQILPCSHKVHKDCATKMIRSGITRCPICRESFAHKLEKRPPPPPGQHFGKK